METECTRAPRVARALRVLAVPAQGVRGDRSWQAAACGLLLTALLACALPEASGFRRLSAAGNYTDDWEDAAEAAQNVTGPLALLHPRLVVFGDSISSIRGTSKIVRKALRLTHLEKYPPPPYFQGRWSNGRVYTEYLADALGLRLVDNAVGGATTGAYNNSVLNVVGSFPDVRHCQPPGSPPGCRVQVVAVPSLLTQVTDYTSEQSIDKLDIMLVEIGPNDVRPHAIPAQVFGGLFGPAQIADGNYNGFADRIVGAIWTALMVLHSAGARRFLVFNVPPISRTPLIARLTPSDASLPNRTAALVDAINGHLQPRIDQFRQLTGAAVVFYANSLLDAQTQPAAPAIGFTNLHDACSTFPVDVFGSPAFAVPPARGNAASICHNPGEYIFWDHVHFTTRFHWLQAGVVAAEMAPLLAAFPP